MITKSELIDYAVEHNIITYDKEIDKVTFIDTGLTTSSDIFLEAYKETTGQSFECIHDEHVSCFSLIRCTVCGTYIFEHYDEDYEPNLRCPICTNYKTNFKYYTVEDIEEDENKKKEIQMYETFAKIQAEADERYKKRGNLYDWEKTHEKDILKGKNYKVSVQAVGFGKGDLEIDIKIWKKLNEFGYTLKKYIKIPLTPHSFYIQVIYRHLGKCHKDLRSKWYIGKAIESR